MELLLEFLIAAVSIVSVVYLLFANYIRIRYRGKLRKYANRVAILVVIPWFFYAAFFAVMRWMCASSDGPFSATLACVLDLLWLFYAVLAVFVVTFVWATRYCLHILHDLRHRPHEVPL